MIDKKELIFAVLATFCLTAALFMVVPTKSQSGSYDARTDVNGDGTIDMADISLGVEGFMTNGDPTLNVNVTNWPTTQPLRATKLIKVLTEVLIAPGGYYFGGSVPVDGYSKVTILMYGSLPQLAVQFEGWEDAEGFGMSYLFEFITDFNGTYTFVKTYDVMCPHIHFFISNLSVGYATIWMSFYLVA